MIRDISKLKKTAGFYRRSESLSHCQETARKNFDKIVAASEKNRKGQYYPIVTNSADCRSVILSCKDTNLLIERKTEKSGDQPL
jgi:hypothetical protein